MPQQREHTRRLYESLYEEACAIVATEYADPLELTAVARRIATSRRQLQRAFAQAGRTTFQDRLTRARMDGAADLLRLRSLRVRDVASRVGYRQPSQFAKAFRRHYGMAPAVYRDHHAPRWMESHRPLGEHADPLGAATARRSPVAAA